MASSPTQRTLDSLRKDGWHCAIVEKWNPHTRTRADLWGFCDILAIRRNEILAVQCTSGGNMSKRVDKITGHENTPKVREAGIRIQVWGWRKLKAGWQARIVDLS